MGQPESGPGRWVIKALTAYTQDDWREFLQADEKRALEYEDLEAEDPFDPGPGPSCGPDDPLPLDPRTYCGKQYAQYYAPTDVRCDNYWRPYRFVGQIGEHVQHKQGVGYERMDLTYYPNRLCMGVPWGIEVKPVGYDTPEGEDENVPAYGPYTKKEFEHFRHMVFTGADVGSDGAMAGVKLPACGTDRSAPKIPSGTNVKIRMHFLGTDAKHETEANKTKDDWETVNWMMLRATRDAVKNINAMCYDSNTGFTVSLLNNDIFCGHSTIHAGGETYSTAPFKYPLTCDGVQADINVFVGRRDALVSAWGTGWTVHHDIGANGGFLGCSLCLSTAPVPGRDLADFQSCILLPTTSWDGPAPAPESPLFVPTSIEFRNITMEEIGHALGLKWDRLSIPVSETMFHDWSWQGHNAGSGLPDYTKLDKKAYEILYLRFLDGSEVFTTDMKMNAALVSFRKWVKEYNEAYGLDTDEGDGDRPEVGSLMSKCVEVSGIKYPAMLDSGAPDSATVLLRELARRRTCNISLIWGDLNGKYTMKSRGGGGMGGKGTLTWEKKEALPPKFYLVTGNVGAYGPHDKRWDGTNWGREHDEYYTIDECDFKWFPDANGKYVQIWPFDVDSADPIGDTMNDWLERKREEKRCQDLRDCEPDGGAQLFDMGGLGDGLGMGGGTGPVVLGGKPPGSDDDDDSEDVDVTTSPRQGGMGPAGWKGSGGGMGGVNLAHVGDMINSPAKPGWNPSDYHWDMGGSVLDRKYEVPVAGAADYMEIFDMSHVCWGYPVYLKYVAKAKIYDDGTKLGTGKNDVMFTEHLNGGQRENGKPANYYKEENVSDTGVNGPSLFCIEYLKLFVSYYKKKEGSSGGEPQFEPTLGPAFETSDGREGKSMGPTWMIVLGDSLSKHERTRAEQTAAGVVLEGPSPHYKAKEAYPEIWENEEYVRTCQTGRNLGTCESEQIIWLYAKQGANGRYETGATEHKIPPAGGPNWRYFGPGGYHESGICGDGGELKLQASENFFRRMVIEKVSSARRNPGADCRTMDFPDRIEF